VLTRTWGSSGAEAIVSDYAEDTRDQLAAAEIEPLSLEEIFIAVTGGRS
jgi:hypothetical protein